MSEKYSKGGSSGCRFPPHLRRRFRRRSGGDRRGRKGMQESPVCVAEALHKKAAFLCEQRFFTWECIVLFEASSSSPRSSVLSAWPCHARTATRTRAAPRD